jgi:extradiol dioxygenase family protein
MPSPAFHLAFPVSDLQATRAFYVDVLGCRVGRSAERWIDFDFYGHQISAHLRPEEAPGPGGGLANEVDGDAVPVRHFGVILEWDAWRALADRVEARGQGFLIRPHIRFEGQIGEQGTFFVLDPSGNALEFKSFRDMDRVFATGEA